MSQQLGVQGKERFDRLQYDVCCEIMDTKLLYCIHEYLLFNFWPYLTRPPVHSVQVCID